jgi:CHAT domain-containing protein
MPQTPGAPSLSGVEMETTAVGGMLPGATVLQGPNATHDSVVAAMPASRVAHFACHGISDWHDPGLSRLLLHDHKADPLTVRAISRLQLPGPDLAYLSACSTTDTSPRLADEALHITSAFQLAGYRNVIGTLWPVSDDAATQIAGDVYGILTRNGAQPPDTSAAARALHHATRRLRADYPNLPTAWAGHIHTGM